MILIDKFWLAEGEVMEVLEETGSEVVETIRVQTERTTGILSDALEYFKKSLPLIIASLIIFIIGILISKLIAMIVGKAVSKSNVNGAAKSFLVSLIKIILYVVVIIMALSVLNVPMSSIITILGAAGLAVSLALQTCLSNLCGGFIILFSKPFSAGDIVEIDGSMGKVREIGVFYTTIVTFDNRTIFIPNGKVSDAKIVNCTETPTRRIDMSFNISYSADFERARALILGIIEAEKSILREPAPLVRMSAHNSSSVAIDVFVWVNNDDYFSERYSMTEKIKDCFDKNAIAIPFEQLDVHIKDSV